MSLPLLAIYIATRFVQLYCLEDEWSCSFDLRGISNIRGVGIFYVHGKNVPRIIVILAITSADTDPCSIWL